jgi:hypothetical protein
MKTIASAMATIAILAMAESVQAQCYYNSYYSSPTYVVRREYVPVAVPVSYPTVAVPIYSYINAGYIAPGYGYPAVSAYPASPYQAMPGYPGYAQGYGQGYGQSYGQQSLNADAIADLVIRRLEQRLNSPPGGSSPGGPPGGSPHQPSGPPKVQPTSMVDAGQAHSLLVSKCATCHSGNGSKGGGFAFISNNKQVLNISREKRWDIYDQVYQGTMPKNGQPLTDQETELIRLWARQK